MKKQSSIEESVHHSGENGRRNFLKICSVVLSSLIGIGYAIPPEGVSCISVCTEQKRDFMLVAVSKKISCGTVVYWEIYIKIS